MNIEQNINPETLHIRNSLSIKYLLA